jgi:hypothetical protein
VGLVKRLASAVAAVAIALVLFLSGCAAESSGPPKIVLEPPAIVVRDVPDEHLSQLRADMTREQWNEVLRVSVAEGQPAMIGDYAIAGNTIRFTPMFPLDAGRQYHVAYIPAKLTATVGLPATDIKPTTVVSHVYPTLDVVPENQLRLYIHFSAPMGLKGGLDYVTLLNERGEKVIDPFLPLDTEFWNSDRTRYTVFFDPGRQKRGITPNQQMGRSLEPGQRYTLHVSREWRDGEGLSLTQDFTRAFRVGPPDERPLDHAAWQVTAPRAGTRDALAVEFGEPLDHGLLLRALGVTGVDGKFLDGDVKVEAGETRWSFTPRVPWTSGAYQLTALAMLEDLAGNRIGRAFEVDELTPIEKTVVPEFIRLPVTIADGK